MRRTGWRIVVSGGLSSLAILASSNPATITSPGTLRPDFDSACSSLAASASFRQTKASAARARRIAALNDAVSSGSTSIAKDGFHPSPRSMHACATPWMRMRIVAA